MRNYQKRAAKAYRTATPHSRVYSTAIQYWGGEGGGTYTTNDIINIKRTKGKQFWNRLKPTLHSVKQGRGIIPSNPKPPVLRALNLKATGIARLIRNKKYIKFAKEDILVPKVVPAEQIIDRYMDEKLQLVFEEFATARRTTEPDSTEQELLEELLPAGLPDLWQPYILPKYIQPTNNEQYDGRSWRSIVDYLQFCIKEHNQPLVDNLLHFLQEFKDVAEGYFLGNGSITGAIGRMEYAGSVHHEAMLLPAPSPARFMANLNTYMPIDALPSGFGLDFDPINWLNGTTIHYHKKDSTGKEVRMANNGVRINTSSDAGVPYNNDKRGDTCIADVIVFRKMLLDLRDTLEGHRTVSDFYERWGYFALYKDKRKREAYKNDKFNTKIRLIAVPSAAMNLGWLYVVQLMSVKKINILSDQRSGSLFGFSFLRGGMNLYVGYLIAQIEKLGYAYAYYADNCFICFRDSEGRMCYISVDGNAQEASNSVEAARMWMTYIVSKLFNAPIGRDGQIKPTQRVHAEWIAYLCEMGPIQACGGNTLMNSLQFIKEYLGSGFATTTVANFAIMAQGLERVNDALKDPENREIDVWVSKDGTPTDFCKEVFNKARILPKVGGHTFGANSIDAALRHPLKLLGTNTGYVASPIDTLGWSLVTVEVSNSRGTFTQAVAVLAPERFMPSLVLRKASLDSLAEIEKVVMEINIYSALYVVGGWLPDYAPAMKAILMGLQSEFIELGGVGQIANAFEEISENDAYNTLHELGMPVEDLNALTMGMAEVLGKGIPTLEAVLRIVAGDAFAEEFVLAVEEGGFEDVTQLLTDKTASRIQKQKKPKLAAPVLSTPLLAGSAPWATLRPISQAIGTGALRRHNPKGKDEPEVNRTTPGRPGTSKLSKTDELLDQLAASKLKVTVPLPNAAEAQVRAGMPLREQEIRDAAQAIASLTGARPKHILEHRGEAVARLVDSGQLETTYEPVKKDEHGEPLRRRVAMAKELLDSIHDADKEQVLRVNNSSLNAKKFNSMSEENQMKACLLSYIMRRFNMSRETALHYLGRDISDTVRKGNFKIDIIDDQ